MGTVSVKSPFMINTQVLDGLTATLAVEAFRDLLWARARRSGLDVAHVSISSEVFAADGGIDSSILDGGPTRVPDELLNKGTRFQIKTGSTCAPWQPSWVRHELFGDKEPTAENLGRATKRCLDDGGKYVLVCFGIDPIDDNIRQAQSNFTQCFQDCGYPDAAVQVFGQTQLIGMFSDFPSLCLRLMGRDHAAFRSHRSWSNDADMRPLLRISPEQQQLLEQIRGYLRSGDIGHIRLIGEPGVGKTRLALEAARTDDLAPVVLYVRDGAAFQQTSFFNELLEPDDSRFVVLVIDECLPKDRASIWNLLSHRANNTRLITIDHGPNDSGGVGMAVIHVPPTGKEQIAAIISDYGIEKHDAERWARFCEGCPRVAHVVGENLRRNPSDLLQNPSTVDVWNRFIEGYEEPSSENVELRKIVLRTASLFERFGFEPPVDAEAKFIAELSAKSDARLTWQRFQAVVYELKQRRILQGVTTLYIAPRLLQIYLYREFWEKHGRGLDLAQLLQSMPPQLWRWFVEMLSFAHTSNVATAAIDQLLGPAGLFPHGQFRDTQANGRLIMALAESNPLRTLRCLQRTIGSSSAEQLLRIHEARQELVWAIERIAVWDEHFVGSTELLMKLAEAENSKNGNNATGTFKDLFSLIPGMAATQAPPSRRIVVLRSGLDSDSPSRRRLVLAAIATALSTYSGSRLVGPEHQGLRETIEFWCPKTYGELWNAHRDVWQLLVEKLATWQAEDRRVLIETIIASAWSALHIPPLTSSVLDTLDSLVDDPCTDIKSLVSFAKRQLRFKENLTEEIIGRLRVLTERLNGHDFASKLRRFVKHASSDDWHDDDWNLSNLVDRKLDELATEAMSSERLLDTELPWLVCENSSPAFCFAFRLGTLDRSRHLLPILLTTYEERRDAAAPSFLSGYFAAIHEQNADEWESLMLALSDMPVIQSRFSDFVISSGLSDATARKVIELCRSGLLDAKTLERWWFTQRLLALSEPVFCELIDLQLSDGRGELWSNAVHMFHTYYLQTGAQKELPDQLTFRLLTSIELVDDHCPHAAVYYWSRLAAAYLSRYPQRTWEFFEAILFVGLRHWGILSDLDTTPEQLLTTIFKSDPARAWDAIAHVYSQAGERTLFGLHHWLAEGGHGLCGSETPGPIRFAPSPTLFEVSV